MPPHIEIESHNHRDGLHRSQQPSGSDDGSNSTSDNSRRSVEELSPLFRDHLEENMNFLRGGMSSSPPCRLDPRVCNLNYSDSKEMMGWKNASFDDHGQQQQHDAPPPSISKPPQKTAAIHVSRIAEIIGPESAYYTKSCPNNEEGVFPCPKKLSPSSPPIPSSSSVSTPARDEKSPKPSKSASTTVCSDLSSPNSTSSSSSSSSSIGESKGKRNTRSIFYRATKYFRRKLTHSEPQQQQLSPERNVI